MPTYAQLQAEPWWGREIVTPELTWLGDELCRRTGRPADAAGDKGNSVHLRGSHRSQEWIRNSEYCTDRSYTVQSGLTADQARHIAGFDFTPGSAEQMIAQCQRLMAALKAGELEEVREFYGNVDGDQVVDGWNNLANRAASSDSSHLWHWHLGLDRRQMHNRALMERIVHIALGDEDMALSDNDAQALIWRVEALFNGRDEVAGGPHKGTPNGKVGAWGKVAATLAANPDFLAKVADAVVAKTPEVTIDLSMDEVTQATLTALTSSLRTVRFGAVES